MKSFLKKKIVLLSMIQKQHLFEAAKFALANTKDIYWIVGGLPKKNDNIMLKNVRKNIIKAYIIGKNVNFFKKQIKDKISFKVTKNLKNSIIQILKDIRLFKKKSNTVLLSPASASFDQFLNFEKRGEVFKKLCKFYAGKHI